MDICKNCEKTHSEIIKCIFCQDSYCKYCIENEQPSIPSKNSIFVSKYFPPIQICIKCFLDQSHVQRNRTFINNIVKKSQTNWMNFWDGRWPYHFLFCGEVWGIWTLHELWTKIFNNTIKIEDNIDALCIRQQMQRVRKNKISDFSELQIDSKNTLPLLTKYIGSDLSKLTLEYLIDCTLCDQNIIDRKCKFDIKYMNVKCAAQLTKNPDCNIMCFQCWNKREICEFCLVEYGKNELIKCHHKECDIQTCYNCCQSYQALEHEENCLVLSKYNDIQNLMLSQSWMSKETALLSCKGYYQLRFRNRRNRGDYNCK